MVVLLVILAFAVGSLWQKVEYLQKGGSPTTNTNNNVAQATAAPQQDPTDMLPDAQAKKIEPVSSSDHLRGNPNASVKIIEYSDLQCPYCSRFHPTLQQAMDEYGDKIAWVYRHFPLEAIHPYARPAALASECVYELGGDKAFWAFADEIFANQDTTLTDLPGTAGSAGVSSSAVKTCLDNKKYADKIDAQYSTGVDAGVNGTPGTFIVNSKGQAWSLPGAVPYSVVKQVIDKALAS